MVGKGATLKFLKVSIQQLTRAERRELALRVALQISVSLLDIVSVSAVGLFTVIAITGEFPEPALWAKSFFGDLGLSLSAVTIVIGLSALLLFTLRTISSVIILRSSLVFLSSKAADFSRKCLERLLSLPVREIEKIGSQDLAFSLSLGSNYLILGTLGSLIGLISDIALTVMLAILFVAYSPIVSLVAIGCGLTVLVGLTRLTSKKSRQLGIRNYQTEIQGRDLIQDTLNTYRESFVRGTLAGFVARFGQIKKNVATVSAESLFLPNMSKYILEVSVLFMGALVGATVLLVETPVNAAAITAMFLAASSRLAPALIRIQQGIIALQGAIGQSSSIRNLLTVIGQDAEFAAVYPSFAGDSSSDSIFKPEIRFTDVNYSIPETEKQLIKNVSFHIKFGEVVAITGKSGEGKSTLLDLMLGLCKQDSGTIQISGQDPNSFLAQHAGKVSFLPQDVWIASGSLRENVLMGLPTGKVSEGQIMESILGSQLLSLEEYHGNSMLDRPLAEGGKNLSGGQKQRLGLARALVTNPRLLLLDEATSKLDSKTEEQFLNFLEQYRGKATIVLVTHSKKAAAFADRVLNLSDGTLSDTSNLL